MRFSASHCSFARESLATANGPASGKLALADELRNRAHRWQNADGRRFLAGRGWAP